MKTKILIAGGILLLLYIGKRKKDASKISEDNEQLELDQGIDIIRDRLHTFLERNLPYSNEEEIIANVMYITDISEMDNEPEPESEPEQEPETE